MSKPICPKRSEHLLGAIKVDTYAHNADYNHSFLYGGSVQFGGWWKPNCIVNKKVAILVPYRNRPEQLDVFLNHMHPILQRQLLNYRIFVIEQVT